MPSLVRNTVWCAPQAIALIFKEPITSVICVGIGYGMSINAVVDIPNWPNLLRPQE